jgi:hypothetical protein
LAVFFPGFKRHDQLQIIVVEHSWCNGAAIPGANTTRAQTVETTAQLKKMARCFVKSAMAARRRTGSVAACSNHLLNFVFIIV